MNSLEPEVVRRQPGVVDLQNDPVVVDGGRQDLQNTKGNHRSVRELGEEERKRRLDCCHQTSGCLSTVPVSQDKALLSGTR